MDGWALFFSLVPARLDPGWGVLLESIPPHLRNIHGRVIGRWFVEKNDNHWGKSAEVIQNNLLSIRGAEFRGRNHTYMEIGAHGRVRERFPKEGWIVRGEKNRKPYAVGGCARRASFFCRPGVCCIFFFVFPRKKTNVVRSARAPTHPLSIERLETIDGEMPSGLCVEPFSPFGAWQRGSPLVNSSCCRSLGKCIFTAVSTGGMMALDVGGHCTSDSRAFPADNG